MFSCNKNYKMVSIERKGKKKKLGNTVRPEEGRKLTNQTQQRQQRRKWNEWCKGLAFAENL
jgi:hypothetical protein